MKKRFGYLRYAPIAAVSASLLLVGCSSSSSGGSSSSGDSNFAPVVNTGVVSIDEMTSVPVINGSATRGTLYIHNDSDKPATGLSFAVSNNSANATASSKLAALLAKIGVKANKAAVSSDGFTLNNPELCSSIPAGGSCAINFTTPGLTAGDLGSSLVTLSYKQNGKTLTTNQVVNYQYAAIGIAQGVNFTGGLTIVGKQGQTQHVVGYLYGSGNAGTIYNNVKLNSTSPVTRISGGFINPQQVAAGQVIAVEYAVDLQNNKPSHVNITPTWGGVAVNTAKYSLKGGDAGGSGVGLGLTLNPVLNTPNLIFGNIPVLTAPTASNTIIHVVNNGNASTSGAITAVASGDQANDLKIDASNCTSALDDNGVGSCSINFSVAGYTSGKTTVEFFDGTTKVGSQAVMWINTTPVPAVKVEPSTIIVNAVAPSLNNTIIFTFTNMGKAPLQELSFVANKTGNASWVADSTNCLNNGTPVTELAPQASCQISGTLSDSSVGSGKLYYSAKGSFSGTSYSFASPAVSYDFTGEATLSITPTSGTVTLAIVGDSTHTASQVFTVTNDGVAPAAISALDIVDTTNPPLDPEPTLPIISSSGTVENQRCTTTTVLNAGEKCDVVVQYGPISSAINVDGTANLSVDYSGGNPLANKNTVDGFAFKLTGDNVSLTIGAAQANDPAKVKGDGTSDDPFLATSASEGLIKIVYTNPSTTVYTLLNINTNDLPIGMTVDTDRTTCPVGSTTATLPVGSSCTLMLKVDRSTLTSSAQGGSTSLNFTEPGASWTTTDGLYIKDGGALVYLNYSQPVVTSSLSVNGSSFTTTDLTMTLSNGGDGVGVGVAVSAVRPWLSTAPTVSGSNCTVDGASYAISCSLSDVAPNTSGTVTYTMPDYLTPGDTTDIPLSFSATSVTDYAYFSPAYTFINYVAPTQ